MAGMLPGVECARRRRLRQIGGWSDSPAATGHGLTRRSSFCLYASNNECHLSFSSSLMEKQKRSTVREGYGDEKLGGVAREAKQRLDEKLRAQRKSETKRNHTQESLRSSSLEGRTAISRALQTEVFGLKNNGSWRFNWAKLRWKPTDQDECAVCLEQFKFGEGLVNLPCAHRFHSKCLAPWLENNSHCPCCRMGILN